MHCDLHALGLAPNETKKNERQLLHERNSVID